MRRILPPILFSLVFAGLCPNALAEAPSDPSAPRVALVDGVKFIVAGIPKTVNERSRFFATFRQALAAQGWATVDPVADAACTGLGDCLAAVAKLAKADFALRLTGEGNLKHGYTINLELYAVDSAQLRASTTFCDICSTDRVAGIAAEFAGKLLAAAAHDRPAAKPATKTPVPAMTGTATAANLQAPRPGSHAPVMPPPATSSRVPWLPWTVTALGVAGLAYGSWALAKDGDASGPAFASSSSTYVHETYSSKTVGLASVIGGGVLAAAGIVWLVATPSKSTTLAASPSRVVLSVRF